MFLHLTKITGGTMDREQWIHHIKSLRDTYSSMLLDLERGDEERVVFTVEAGIYRYDLDIDEELNDIDIKTLR